jgi:hypothetical protein
MVAAGCELRVRFTGSESQALSPDFIMVAAGRRGECREWPLGRCGFGGCERVAASCEAQGLQGARFARHGFGRREACEARVW